MRTSVENNFGVFQFQDISLSISVIHKKKRWFLFNVGIDGLHRVGCLPVDSFDSYKMVIDEECL